MNLATIPLMEKRFGCAVGLSDHTLDDVAAVAAIALGASVIEKHLTVSRDLPGPDHAASLEPAEFAEMVRGVRDAQAALGSPRKQPTAAERRAIIDWVRGDFTAMQAARQRAEGRDGAMPAHGLGQGGVDQDLRVVRRRVQVRVAHQPRGKRAEVR